MGVVPNAPGAIVEFSSKNPFTEGVNLGGGPFRIEELNIWNSGGMGWTFEYGTLVFGPGGRIIVENTASVEPIVENGTFDLSGPVTLTVMAGGRFKTNPTGAITGPGSLTIRGAGEVLFNNLNSYTGGTIIDGGRLSIGDGWDWGELTPGTVVNNGTLRFNRRNNVSADQAISGTGALEKLGAGRLTLTGNSSYSGTTTIQEGTLQIGAGGTTGSIGGGPISINAAASLVLNRSDAMTMPNVITGAGTLNQIGSGATTLSGNSSTFNGTTNVNAGSLLVTGSLGGTVNVNSGALLGGTGTVGTAGLTTSIASGGQLSPGLSPGTLTIAGNLSLAAGSITNFELRTPGVAGGVGPGANDLVNVNGNLSIANGAILNVNAAVSGSYRLFNVNGTITPGGGANLGFTTINTIGGLYTATLFQTAGTPNEVNLLLASAGQIVQAFDGADLTGAQAGAQGGAGVWGGTTTNWTQNPNGVLNDRWLGQVGVFGGAAGGAVNVSGPVNFQGLQFTANGYVLSGGAINAVGNGVGGGNAMASFLNIDPGVTTTIAGSITGAAGVGLDKLGRGTLVLSGANLHSGMTDIQAGVVTIRNGAALGVGDGAATTGTRVRTEAALEIAGGITVANEALFLNGEGIANGGALRSLSGANVWNGPVTLEATSRINTDSGTFTLGGAIGGAGRSLTIGGAGATIVNGAIATGAGALTHDGTGTLTLNGANSFTGLTTNLSGTLTNNGSLAGGVSNAATFSNAGAIGTWLVNSAQATNLTGGTIAQGVTNSGNFGNSGTIGGPLLNTSKASNLSDGSIGQGVTNSGTFDNAGAVSGGLANAGTASNLVTGSIHQGVTNRAGFSNFGTVNGGLVNLAKASNLAGGTIHQGVANGGFLDSKGAIHGGLTNEGEVSAAGQLNGAVVNRHGGLFTVAGALGGAMPSFDNAGIVGIGAGAITGVSAFRNNGLLMASDGGARTLGAATFSNQSSGMVTQANGKPTDVLSITGDFVGAPGSRILQDINLAQPRGAATNGDRVMVGGSASGTTTFIFTPTNESRAAFGEPIPVFTATGENSMVANEGKIGHLGQGFFDYFLRRNAARSGFEIASSYNSTPAAGVAGSLGGLTSSHQSSFNQSFSSIVPRATDCRPNQAIGSPFIRMGTGGLASRAASAGEMSGGCSDLLGLGQIQCDRRGLPGRIRPRPLQSGRQRLERPCRSHGRCRRDQRDEPLPRVDAGFRPRSLKPHARHRQYTLRGDLRLCHQRRLHGRVRHSPRLPRHQALEQRCIDRLHFREPAPEAEGRWPEFQRRAVLSDRHRRALPHRATGRSLQGTHLVRSPSLRHGPPGLPAHRPDGEPDGPHRLRCRSQLRAGRQNHRRAVRQRIALA